PVSGKQPKARNVCVNEGRKMQNGDLIHRLEVNPAAERSERSYEPTPVMRNDHVDDAVTRFIEQQSAKFPSSFFLFAALGSMALSLGLELSGRDRASRFVGLWAPAILTMGVYNKVIKLLGAR
ncbi:MAG TPA: hypothetical protein VF190_10640, partial [Rhodothermales bacterium]